MQGMRIKSHKGYFGNFSQGRTAARQSWAPKMVGAAAGATATAKKAVVLVARPAKKAVATKKRVAAKRKKRA